MRNGKARVWLGQPERRVRHPALPVTGRGLGALRTKRAGHQLRIVWGHRRIFLSLIRTGPHI